MPLPWLIIGAVAAVGAVAAAAAAASSKDDDDDYKRRKRERLRGEISAIESRISNINSQLNSAQQASNQAEQTYLALMRDNDFFTNVNAQSINIENVDRDSFSENSNHNALKEKIIPVISGEIQALKSFHESVTDDKLEYKNELKQAVKNEANTRKALAQIEQMIVKLQSKL